MLPEGIDEVLPPAADRLEQLRRRILDCYRSWGYELILTPFVEFLESLLTGTGKDLEAQTFKLMDPLSGRMMGIRADITPQAARIEAHRLDRDVPVRLCYLGTVLRASAGELGGSRAPLQVGAELYGHAGIESDLEVLELMLETLHITGVQTVHVDLGHVAIYRRLARHAGLEGRCEAALFDALQRKARPEIEGILAEARLADRESGWLAALAELNGGPEVLGEARERLAGAPDGVLDALGQLETVAREMGRRHPHLPLHFDLAELRGYNYQTGLVFAAFTPGYGRELARGGRYDHIGRVFGRARPATGFSADLKALLLLAEGEEFGNPGGILAPAENDSALEATIASLRAAGERVIRALPGLDNHARQLGCDRRLVRSADGWKVEPVAEGE